MYHGILLDAEFIDPTYPERLDVFAKRKSSTNNWILYGVKVVDEMIEEVASEVRLRMKQDKPYYAHFYNDEKLIVLFKNQTFVVTPHIHTWTPIIEQVES